MLANKHREPPARMSEKSPPAASSAYVLPHPSAAEAGSTTSSTAATAAAATTTWREHRDVLPKFLQLMLALNESKCNRAVIMFSSAISAWLPACVMAQITKSLPLGAIFGGSCLIIGVLWTLVMPNVGEGIFLEIILEDPGGFTDKARQQFWGAVIAQNLIFMPIVFFLIYLPFVQTQLGKDMLGGPAATPWLIGLYVVIWLMNFHMATMDCLGMVPTQATEMWEGRVREYFLRVRAALLDGDDLERGVSANDKIASAQAAVEAWSRELNARQHNQTTVILLFVPILVFTCFAMLAGVPSDASDGDRAVAFAINALFALIMSAYFIQALHAAAKPNLSFERLKRELLNDVRVVDANVKRGWTKRELDEWLSGHEVSAARALAAGSGWRRRNSPRSSPGGGYCVLEVAERVGGGGVILIYIGTSVLCIVCDDVYDDVTKTTSRV